MGVCGNVYGYMIISHNGGNCNPLFVGNALINSDRLSSLYAGCVESDLCRAITCVRMHVCNSDVKILARAQGEGLHAGGTADTDLGI